MKTKKRGVILVVLLLLMVTFAGCSVNAEKTTDMGTDQEFDGAGNNGVLHETDIQVPEGDLVEINERLFIAQSNDIYLNTEDYLKKTIKYEGLFKTEYWEEVDTTYGYVIRYGPGCCGYDGEAGFEIVWDGEWPNEDDWCEVIGTPEIYEEDGIEYLRLRLSALNVLEKRGAEYVSM